MMVDRIAHLSDRLDAFEVRKAERAEQLCRDAEAAETARIEAYLASLPSLDDPRGDDGELEVKPPPDAEEDYPEHRNEALTGDLPKELERGAPPESGDRLPSAPRERPSRPPVTIGGP
jgi:hypothetical protein